MLRPTAYWGFIVLAINITILGPLLLPMLAEFHLSPGSAGSLFVASSGGYILAGLIGGPAGDRFGRAVLLPAGALIFGLGLLGVSIVPTWELAALALFTTSIGSAIVDAGTNALISDVAKPQDRAREQSLLHASFGFGALLGPLIAGTFLALHLGWRPPYLLAGIGALSVFLLYRKAPIPPQPKREEAVSLRSVARLARIPFMLALIVLIGMYIGAEILVGDWAAAYLQTVQQMDKVAAATSVSLFWTGLALGRLFSALATRWLSDRALLLGSCAVALGAAILLVGAQNVPLALLGLLLTGLGFAPIFPLVMAVGSERFPDQTGSVAGLLLATGSGFGAAIPWLGGVLVQLVDARAALALTIPLSMLMVGLAVVMFFGAQQQRRRVPAGELATAAAESQELV